MNNSFSLEFHSTTGAFQGDALSGNLTLVEAAALIHLRAVLSKVTTTPYVVNHPIPNPPFSNDYMPLETGYSDTLYARCNVTPLSTRVNWFRWRMLGHILRGAEDSPAYLYIVFAINSDNIMIGRLGRPSINLLDVIRKDLVRKNLNNKLKHVTDFENLRFLALERKGWKELEKL